MNSPLSNKNSFARYSKYVSSDDSDELPTLSTDQSKDFGISSNNPNTIYIPWNHIYTQNLEKLSGDVTIISSTCQSFTCIRHENITGLHLILPKCTSIVIRGCNKLQHITGKLLWCSTFNVRWCESITSIPTWLPVCKKFMVERLPLLESITTFLPKCIYFYCADNRLLKKMPHILPKCKVFHLYKLLNCTEITETLPSCTTFMIYYCRVVQNFPKFGRRYPNKFIWAPVDISDEQESD